MMKNKPKWGTLKNQSDFVRGGKVFLQYVAEHQIRVKHWQAFHIQESKGDDAVHEVPSIGASNVRGDNSKAISTHWARASSDPSPVDAEMRCLIRTALGGAVKMAGLGRRFAPILQGGPTKLECRREGNGVFKTGSRIATMSQTSIRKMEQAGRRAFEREHQEGAVVSPSSNDGGGETKSGAGGDGGDDTRGDGGDDMDGRGGGRGGGAINVGQPTLSTMAAIGIEIGVLHYDDQTKEWSEGTFFNHAAFKDPHYKAQVAVMAVPVIYALCFEEAIVCDLLTIGDVCSPSCVHGVMGKYDYCNDDNNYQVGSQMFCRPSCYCGTVVFILSNSYLTFRYSLSTLYLSLSLSLSLSLTGHVRRTVWMARNGFWWHRRSYASRTQPHLRYYVSTPSLFVTGFFVF